MLVLRSDLEPIRISARLGSSRLRGCSDRLLLRRAASGWGRCLVLPILILGACSLPSCESRREGWPYAVTLGDARINVEVVKTEAERNVGLMFRSELGRDWGMLFVYDREEPLTFWMKNTRIPLSIAFIDRTLAVRDIQDMQPMSEVRHTSKAPVVYALEANRGWFARHGVTVGTRVKFSPKLEELIGEK